MNGGNSVLMSGREKRILFVLGVFFGAALVFLFYLGVIEKPGLGRAERELAKRRESCRNIDAERAKKKEESLMWQQGLRDIKEVRQTWYYQKADGIRPFMSDVGQILGGAAIESPQSSYDYSEVRGENTERVSVTFNCSCSYFMLKRLFDDLERFPKFLFLERLDFHKTPDKGQTLELSITLTGYYARN
jgi:hypothetical protein